MQYIVENCGAKALIVDGIAAEAAPALRRSATSLRVALAVDVPVDGFDDFHAAAAEQSGDVLEDEIEGTDLIYSSGTTGRPKGGRRPVQHCHPRDFDMTGINAFFGCFRLNDRDTRYLTPSAPLYHAAVLRFSMAVTRYGGTNVIMDRFDAEAALRAIERHRVAHSQWVPTTFARLLRLPDATRGRYDLSSHRVTIHAAAPARPRSRSR